MVKPLTKKEFLSLSQLTKQVLVFKEFSLAKIDFVTICEILAEKLTSGAILESGLHNPATQHYSYLAFTPLTEIKIKSQGFNQKITQPSVELFQELRAHLAALARGCRADMTERLCSAIGFMSYDAIRQFENIQDRHPQDENLADIAFNFYRTTLIYDHQNKKLLISIVTTVTDHPEQDYYYAKNEILNLINKIKSANPTPKTTLKTATTPPVTVDTDDDNFKTMVKRAQQYIVNGDAYQIVLSRAFKQNYTVSPFTIYCALREISPSPYMFYLSLADRVLIGASPEKLISVRHRHIAINPLAGTRKRSQQTNDADMSNELLNDAKELAEHRMLVDLARNDLGSVCEPGSIQIDELLKVRHYSHVSHITSVVTGLLSETHDAFSALAAAFPAGTLSGAPKLRAMQIIDELETTRRGIYGGAICRLDYQGNLDSCIAIRMAELKAGIATVRAGAGIVYDSDPHLEAEETRQKAASMLEAIAAAHRSLRVDLI